jgi:hypothetical protein
MQKITFELDRKFDDKFRSTVAQTKGLRQGVLQETFMEEISYWIETHNANISSTGTSKNNMRRIDKNE